MPHWPGRLGNVRSVAQHLHFAVAAGGGTAVTTHRIEHLTAGEPSGPRRQVHTVGKRDRSCRAGLVQFSPLAMRSMSRIKARPWGGCSSGIGPGG